MHGTKDQHAAHNLRKASNALHAARRGTDMTQLELFKPLTAKQAEALSKRQHLAHQAEDLARRMPNGHNDELKREELQFALAMMQGRI